MSFGVSNLTNKGNIYHISHLFISDNPRRIIMTFLRLVMIEVEADEQKYFSQPLHLLDIVLLYPETNRASRTLGH